MDLKEFESFKTANSVRHPWESARVLIIKRLFGERESAQAACAPKGLKDNGTWIFFIGPLIYW